MNVPLLQMPVDLAQAKYEQYKAALADRQATEEDAQILLGYKALAAGKQLLDLRAVFRTCPIDAKGLPRLAIARASWRWCVFNLTQQFGIFAKSDSFAYVPTWKPTRPHGHIRVPASSMPKGLTSKNAARALVPIIPAQIRPKTKDLSRYYVLFEAEWEPIPPKDPLLLSRLSGSLYVILAAWDLTELERAVLAGRFLEPTA